MIWKVRHNASFSAGCVSKVEIERQNACFHVHPAGWNPGQAADVDDRERFHFGMFFVSLASFVYCPSANKARIQSERIKLLKIFYGFAFL